MLLFGFARLNSVFTVSPREKGKNKNKNKMFGFADGTEQNKRLIILLPSLPSSFLSFPLPPPPFALSFSSSLIKYLSWRLNLVKLLS